MVKRYVTLGEMEEFNVLRLRYIRFVRQTILRLFKSGTPVKEIAKKLHVSQKTVYRHLKAMNINLPERKRENGRFI